MSELGGGEFDPQTLAVTPEIATDSKEPASSVPVETTTGNENVLVTEPPKTAETVSTAANYIKPEQLRELGLNWGQFCAASEAERLAMVREVIQATSTEPAETFDSKSAENQLEILLGTIADSSAKNITEGQSIQTAGWLRRAVSGLRSFGFSEIGRFVLAKTRAGEGDSEQVAALESSIRTQRAVEQANKIAGAVTVMGAASMAGQAIVSRVKAINPIFRGASAFLTGVSTYFSAQQLSYSVSGVLQERRITKDYLSSSTESEELAEKRHDRQIARFNSRAEKRGQLKGLARIFDKLTDNAVLDWFLKVDERYLPEELERLAATGEWGKINAIVGVLQYELDRRWARGDKEAGLLGDAEDWQFELYIKALELLANQGVASESAAGFANSAVQQAGKLKEAEHSRYARSQLVGMAAGVGAGVLSWALGIGKAQAQPATPAPVAPVSTPEVTNPEWHGEAASYQIRLHALELLGQKSSSENWSSVESAIAHGNDQQFYTLTGQHLDDLRYLEHSIRAELLENAQELAKQNGAEVAGISEVNGRLVFESLNKNQLDSALGDLGQTNFNFTDYRIGEVVAATQPEAASAGFDADKWGSMQTQLHEHLTNYVNNHRNEDGFTLTNLSGESSLRAEARDWLHGLIEKAKPKPDSDDYNPSVDIWSDREEPITTTVGQTPTAPARTAAEFFSVEPGAPIEPAPVTLIDLYSGSEQPTEYQVENHYVPLSDQWSGYVDVREPATTHSALEDTQPVSAGLVEPTTVTTETAPATVVVPDPTPRAEVNHPAAIESQVAAGRAATVVPEIVVKPATEPLVEPIVVNRDPIELPDGALGAEIPNEAPSFQVE